MTKNRYATIAGTTLTTEIFEAAVDYKRSVSEAIRLAQYIYKYWENKKAKSVVAGPWSNWQIEAADSGWIIKSNAYNKYDDRIYYIWNDHSICFFSFENCGVVFRIYDAAKSNKLVDANYGFQFDCKEFNDILQKYNLGKCFKIN